MSEEVQLVKCPLCGSPGIPGDFCEMGCGRLPGPEAESVPGQGQVAAPRPSREETRTETAPTRRPDSAPTAPAGGEPWWAPRPEGAEPARPVVPPARPAAANNAGRGIPTADLKLEYDALCVFFEHVPGVLRFRITAERRLEGVTLEMENPLTREKLARRPLRSMEAGTMREIGVSMPGQAAGAVGWYLTVAYEVDGRKRLLEGEAPVLSLKPREAQMAAKNLSVTINNNISNGNASDISLSQHAAEDLEHLAHDAENPYEALRKIVQGDQRAWTQANLDRGGAQEALPPMPEGAMTSRLTLELGGGRLHLRVGRTVTAGRSRSGCDIALRPRPDAQGAERDRYLMISRRHCHFEARGKQILVEDGYRDGLSGVKPSSFGTFWNKRRIDGSMLLNAGDTGTLSLGGEPSGNDGTSFKAKACPPCGKCAVCTKIDRSWCGDGQHACLLLNRQGDKPEAYVAMWGCFGLGEADPAFEGITLFRERGAFAWRRGRHCGWLVPGTDMQTEFGTLRVRGEEGP